MRPFRALISLDEAMTICMQSVNPIKTIETLPIDNITGRVAATDVHAKISVPLVDRAAMDGYAVRASDTYGATKFKPRVLKRIEVLYADSVPKKTVIKGKCSEVATGATMPNGADGVVMVEDTQSKEPTVSIYKPVHPGENVSVKGEDIKKGDMVIVKGEVLTPAKVGALAAVGVSHLKVFQKPSVAVLTTGDEVIEPGKPIRPGQVYNINAVTLNIFLVSLTTSNLCAKLC